MRLMHLLILIVIVVAVCSYLGWLHFSSNSQDIRTNINVSVDKDKIRADTNKAATQLEDLGQRAKDKVTTMTTQTTSSTPSASPRD